MQIYLYDCADDPRLLNKTLNNAMLVNCQLYEQCSIYQPTLILTYDYALTKKNYTYVPDWGRYYFIINQNVDKGSKIIISAFVDVLMTYKDNIKSCAGMCVRNEGIGRPTDIPDDEFPIRPASNFITTYNVGSYFDIAAESGDGTLHYLLATK